MTRFIKLCDVEQRLNTENINLLTQSSKESISLAYCTIFEQMSGFLPGFPTVAVRKALRGEGKRQKAQRNGLFYAHVIDSNNE